MFKNNVPVLEHNIIGSNILPIIVKQRLSSENIFSPETLSQTEGNTPTQDIHSSKESIARF